MSENEEIKKYFNSTYDGNDIGCCLLDILYETINNFSVHKENFFDNRKNRRIE